LSSNKQYLTETTVAGSIAVSTTPVGGVITRNMYETPKEFTKHQKMCYELAEQVFELSSKLRVRGSSTPKVDVAIELALKHIREGLKDLG
jgi:hypothetical protein